MDTGDILRNVEDMQEYFVKQYEKLYSNKDVQIDKFQSFDKYIPKIDTALDQEDGPITLEEVKSVVFGIASD